MHKDAALCFRIVQAKDARFDGMFFTAVVTTGIYCRPSCPAVAPKPRNVRFYPSAAAAQSAGFRACRRCRPDASPGSPEWNARADIVARAVRLIADGVVDRDGVPGLACHLGYSTRQLERQLLAELGAGPLALARAQRAQTSRLLAETTSMPMAEIAFASGFASVRAFNGTVREVFGLSPTELRQRAGPRDRRFVHGVVSLRLPYRAPLCEQRLFEQLAVDALPGVEELRDGAYRRTLRLPHGHGIAALRARPGYIACELALTDLRDLAIAISRCRRLLDLDADPVAIDAALGSDPVLAPLVERRPGTRVTHTVDPVELAVRATLGQRLSRSAARKRAMALVTTHGSRIEDPVGGLTHLFPDTEALASLDPAELEPTADGGLAALVRALADGRLDLGPGCDWLEARSRLGEVAGMGQRLVEAVAMRALGDPDAFALDDRALLSGARALGLASTPAALDRRSRNWRPWRAYAAQHIAAAGRGTAHAHAVDGGQRHTAVPQRRHRP